MQIDLTGLGFEMVPSDAIGIGSTDNDNPLMYIDNTNPLVLMDITEKTMTTLKLDQSTVNQHSYPIYLGAIVSADRQAVYWVNETRPLP